MTCRDCGAEVERSAARCPGCGSQTPFSCAVCEKALSSYTLGTRRSNKYPHGSFDAEGRPVCAEHRPTRCHRCRQVFPHLEMTRQVIGRREDHNLRRGMDPRREEVFAEFCPVCLPHAAPRRSTHGGTGHWIVWVVLGMVAAGVLIPLLIAAASGGR